MLSFFLFIRRWTTKWFFAFKTTRNKTMCVRWYYIIPISKIGVDFMVSGSGGISRPKMELQQGKQILLISQSPIINMSAKQNARFIKIPQNCWCRPTTPSNVGGAGKLDGGEGNTQWWRVRPTVLTKEQSFEMRRGEVYPPKWTVLLHTHPLLLP